MGPTEGSLVSSLAYGSQWRLNLSVVVWLRQVSPVDLRVSFFACVSLASCAVSLSDFWPRRPSSKPPPLKGGMDVVAVAPVGEPIMPPGRRGAQLGPMPLASHHLLPVAGVHYAAITHTSSALPPDFFRVGAFFTFVEPPLPYRQQLLTSIAEVRTLVHAADGHWYVGFRLFFAPEDTPSGRLGRHGADELLASWRRVYCRLETLIETIQSVPQPPVCVLPYLDYCRRAAADKMELAAGGAPCASSVLCTYFVRRQVIQTA